MKQSACLNEPKKDGLIDRVENKINIWKNLLHEDFGRVLETFFFRLGKKIFEFVKKNCDVLL